MDESRFRAQLPFTLQESRLTGFDKVYCGKVRDTYQKGDRLVMVTTDRISAFDRVLGTIPFKGEILNRTAAFWFQKTSAVVPNHLLEIPDPNVMVARACRPLPVEFIVRGYLTGSLWRDFQNGKIGYGVKLPANLRKDQAFSQPILTPTTKAELGQHDQPISREEILSQGLVEKRYLDMAYEYSLALYKSGQQWAETRGLILVDTKYEFGIAGDELLVIDEIHTMDSSRYWETSEYEIRFSSGHEQKMLDKENIRQWLVKERGFTGEGEVPLLPDEIRLEATKIYATAFERITGHEFISQAGDPLPRIKKNIEQAMG